MVFFAPAVVPVVLFVLFVLGALAAGFVLLLVPAAVVPEADTVLLPVVVGFAGCCLAGVVLPGAWPAVLVEAGVAPGFADLVPVALAVLVTGTLVWATDVGAVVLEAALAAFLFAAGVVVLDAGFAAVATVAVLPEAIFVPVVVGMAFTGDVTSALPALAEEIPLAPLAATCCGAAEAVRGRGAGAGR